jgi:penicillin-binding protein A
VNRQIAHMFGFVVILFGLLIAFTSRWSVLEANTLKQDTADRRPLLEQQRIPRGLILGRDGTPLAQNQTVGSGQFQHFVRNYPQGPLASHFVGYSFINQGSYGLEQSYNTTLSGHQSDFGAFIGALEGSSAKGQDIHTTLDPQAQGTALQALGGRPGSVVALEPQTGRIRVMASVPGFDPNQIPQRFSQLNQENGSPLFNRATQARYPPGSTMKVVTAAAALDTGKFTPDSMLNGRSPQQIGGAPLANFQGEQFGDISLTDALTHSVNTVFAQVGEGVGKQTMYDYMQRFGFNSRPPINYPPSELTASGVFKGNAVLGPTAPVDIGRVAIGQERLQVTPLQMAMVSSAVANNGVLMRPQLVESVNSPYGGVDSVDPEPIDTVMKPSTAQELTAMMSRVVQEGTGTQAALSGGVNVAGKTGTAEIGGGSQNQVWFIGFAPVQNPRMAIAVTIERAPGQGGTVAAPIAKTVLQQLLSK